MPEKAAHAAAGQEQCTPPRVYSSHPHLPPLPAATTSPHCLLSSQPPAGRACQPCWASTSCAANCPRPRTRGCTGTWRAQRWTPGDLSSSPIGPRHRAITAEVGLGVEGAGGRAGAAHQRQPALVHQAHSPGQEGTAVRGRAPAGRGGRSGAFDVNSSSAAGRGARVRLRRLPKPRALPAAGRAAPVKPSIGSVRRALPPSHMLSTHACGQRQAYPGTGCSNRVAAVSTGQPACRPCGTAAGAAAGGQRTGGAALVRCRSMVIALQHNRSGEQEGGWCWHQAVPAGAHCPPPPPAPTLRIVALAP